MGPEISIIWYIFPNLRQCFLEDNRTSANFSLFTQYWHPFFGTHHKVTQLQQQQQQQPQKFTLIAANVSNFLGLILIYICAPHHYNRRPSKNNKHLIAVNSSTFINNQNKAQQKQYANHWLDPEGSRQLFSVQ
jgi:hypothetical protein